MTFSVSESVQVPSFLFLFFSASNSNIFLICSLHFTSPPFSLHSCSQSPHRFPSSPFPPPPLLIGSTHLHFFITSIFTNPFLSFLLYFPQFFSTSVPSQIDSVLISSLSDLFDSLPSHSLSSPVSSSLFHFSFSLLLSLPIPIFSLQPPSSLLLS